MEENINAIKIAELEKRLTLIKEYSERAVEAAASELKVRLHAANEFREQLKDQSVHFVKRDEVDSRLKSVGERIGELDRLINDRLGALEKTISNYEGRIWAFSVISSLVGTALSSIVFLLLKGH